MSDVSIEKIAETMFKLVEQDAGKKKYKPGDLTKKMIEVFGEDQVNKKDCKNAIKELVNSGKLVYTYFGGSFIEVPHEEAALKK